ncbi:unnamed protein product [Triticum turgidum subsp. durum]|uniref:Uncharacterized protein n=1 Tax=Triticum turgidum subsp. durum TaxID=4567 RepID=A0A9R0VKE5_TRITD|nr:unnamed protein product [Triticum turgidum subsp. durum]
MVGFFRSGNLASRVFDRQFLSPRPGATVRFFLLPPASLTLRIGDRRSALATVGTRRAVECGCFPGVRAGRGWCRCGCRCYT